MMPAICVLCRDATPHNYLQICENRWCQLFVCCAEMWQRCILMLHWKSYGNEQQLAMSPGLTMHGIWHRCQYYHLHNCILLSIMLVSAIVVAHDEQEGSCAWWAIQEQHPCSSWASTRALASIVDTIWYVWDSCVVMHLSPPLNL